MVLPLIPIALSLLGGVALGGYEASGKSSEVGAGFLEIGTKKELTKINYSTQDSYTYSPTTTSTQTYAPVDNFSPNYSFNPMTAIGSGEFNFTKKEAYSQALNPSWDLPVNVQPSTSTSQSAEQSTGGSGSDLMESVKQFALLGAVGFVVYKVVTKK